MANRDLSQILGLKRLQLKSWESALIIIAALLFLTSSTAYLSGISLRKYILGWNDEEDTEKVGTLAKKSGSLRRLRGSSNEFEAIDSNQDLFNFDTVITGDDGGALIVLDDSSEIELGPNSMVRLVFEDRLGFQGLSRLNQVEVVSGKVQSRAKTNRVVLRSKKKVIPIDSDSHGNIEVALPKRATPPPAAAPVQVPVPVEPSPSPSPIPSPSPSPSPLPSLKPTAKPAPVQKIDVSLLSPARDAVLVLEEQSEDMIKDVELKWSVKGANIPLQLEVKKENGEESFRQVVRPGENLASAILKLSSPGSYLWELKHPQGQKIARASSRFILRPEYVGIELLPTLVGGAPLDSNEYTGDHIDNFDITFRWKPHPKAKKYRLQILAAPNSDRPLFEKEVETSEYKFNKDKIYNGHVFYRVIGELPSGFVATSKPEPFIFNFAPPILVQPESGASFSLTKLKKGNSTVLLTWQKTNFTDQYEVEISNLPDFKNLLLKRKVKQNFFMVASLPKGALYWRVRSLGKGMSSPASKASQLTVID